MSRPTSTASKASAPRSKSTSTTAACPAKAAACRGVVAPAVSQTFASSPASSNNSAHFGAPAMAAWWSAVRPPLLFESWTRAAPRCNSSSTHPSQPAAAARWSGGLKCARSAAPSGSPPASRASFRWCASAACAWKWTAVSFARRVGATTQRDAVAGLWAFKWAAISLRPCCAEHGQHLRVGSPNQVLLQCGKQPVGVNRQPEAPISVAAARASFVRAANRCLLVSYKPLASFFFRFENSFGRISTNPTTLHTNVTLPPAAAATPRASPARRQ